MFICFTRGKRKDDFSSMEDVLKSNRYVLDTDDGTVNKLSDKDISECIRRGIPFENVSSYNGIFKVRPFADLLNTEMFCGKLVFRNMPNITESRSYEVAVFDFRKLNKKIFRLHCINMENYHFYTISQDGTPVYRNIEAIRCDNVYAEHSRFTLIYRYADYIIMNFETFIAGFKTLKGVLVFNWNRRSFIHAELYCATAESKLYSKEFIEVIGAKLRLIGG